MLPEMRFDKKELTQKEGEISAFEMPVRFQDVDAAGIVFFARFFEYVHAAFEDFIAGTGESLAEVLATRAWASPLKHVEADYFAPLAYGDVVRVRLVEAVVDTSEIHLGWCLEKLTKDGKKRTSAALQTIHVFVSLPDFQKIPVPGKIAAALNLGQRAQAIGQYVAAVGPSD